MGKRRGHDHKNGDKKREVRVIDEARRERNDEEASEQIKEQKRKEGKDCSCVRMCGGEENEGERIRQRAKEKRAR